MMHGEALRKEDRELFLQLRAKRARELVKEVSSSVAAAQAAAALAEIKDGRRAALIRHEAALVLDPSSTHIYTVELERRIALLSALIASSHRLEDRRNRPVSDIPSFVATMLSEARACFGDGVLTLSLLRPSGKALVALGKCPMFSDFEYRDPALPPQTDAGRDLEGNRPSAAAATEAAWGNVAMGRCVCRRAAVVALFAGRAVGLAIPSSPPAPASRARRREGGSGGGENAEIRGVSRGVSPDAAEAHAKNRKLSAGRQQHAPQSTINAWVAAVAAVAAASAPAASAPAASAVAPASPAAAASAAVAAGSVGAARRRSLRMSTYP
ncbi:unnamed protein product [Phaeothamnion confervicola]